MPQIIKPFRLGIMTKTLPYEGRGLLTVSAYAVSDLSAPRDLLMEMSLWPMVAKELPEGEIFDEANPKPSGEWLVAGSAVAPGDPVQAMAVEVAVGGRRKRLAVVGERHWIAGHHGPVHSPPRPFTDVLLSPKLAFGGPHHHENPDGRGHGALNLYEAGHRAPLPRIENPEAPIRQIEDEPVPHHFGPIPPTAPVRLDRMGTYDGAWLAHFPELPHDFDPLYFSVAPADQRIDGFFRGDETVEVHGMSARVPHARGQLPGIRARAFIRRRDEPLRELKMRLDTVWVFGTEQKTVPIWRGRTLVDDREAADVEAIMIAYENLEDEPRPLSHYHEVMALRIDPEGRFRHLLADGQLSPPPDPAEAERRRAARYERGRAAMEEHRRHRQWIADRGHAESGLPPELAPRVPPAPIDPLPLPTEEDIARNDIDLASLIDALEEMARALEEKAAVMQHEAQATLKPVLDASPLGRHLKPPVPIPDLPPGARPPEPPAALAEQTEALARGHDVEELLKGFGFADPEAQEKMRAGVTGLMDAFERGLHPADDEEAFEAAKARALMSPDATPLAPVRRQLDGVALPDRKTDHPPGTSPDQSILSFLDEAFADPEADPERMGKARESIASVDRMLGEFLPNLPKDADGRALPALLEQMERTAREQPPLDPAAQLEEARAMLAEADAEAARTTAAARRAMARPIYPLVPLSPAVARRLGAFVLEAARTGTGFAGADLAGIDLAGEDLSGLDLSGAFLERADLSRARLAGTNLAGAVLTGARLREADLRGAELSDANMAGVDATSARLSRARLAGTRLDGAVLARADLSGARIKAVTAIGPTFDGASLAGARIDDLTVMQGSFAGVDLSRARVRDLTVMDADATGLVAREASLEETSFMKAPLPGADFSGAAIAKMTFAVGSDARGARFDGARVQRLSAFRGALRGAVFRRARLSGASFFEADLTDADFTFAAVRACDLANARLKRADLTGADLFASRLHRAVLVHAGLRHASLYRADLSDAVLVGADLSGANLNATLMEARR